MKNRGSILTILLIIGALLVTAYFIARQKSPVQQPNLYQVTPEPTNLQMGVGTSEVNQGINLEVTDPANGARFTNSPINIKGKTSPGAEVSVNDLSFKADANGNFSTFLVLDEGENTINIVVNDNQGNFAEKELIVTLETLL